MTKQMNWPRSLTNTGSRTGVQTERFILNPAVDPERSGNLRPVLQTIAGEIKRVADVLAGSVADLVGNVVALRSGCDTTAAPRPTAPLFRAAAQRTVRCAHTRGAPPAARHACCSPSAWSGRRAESSARSLAAATADW